MKEACLRLLVCPLCHGTLECDPRTRDDGDIMEGFLRCACSAVYPVIKGVPRMLPQHLLIHLTADYPEFFEKYAEFRPGSREKAEREVQRHTQEAFGYEWTWAADYHAQNFGDWLPEGCTAEQLFTGNVGLEVGCGAGRHAFQNSALAREHFAVDLSPAVDSAFEKNRSRPNCYIVQADSFHLPFRDGTFDYVYCLGVLQHMHNPPEGFRALSKKPRAGGVLLVNVYQASRPMLIGALNVFRRLTTRMSNNWLRRVSVTCGIVDYWLFVAPWKALRHSSFGRSIERFVPGRIREYARHDYHTCVVDWFDRLSCPVKEHYTREQLAGWYQEAGYERISVTPYWKAFWNGIGTRSER